MANGTYIEVWGDFACFTQPETEGRQGFSHLIITPSAARSIFDAIYFGMAYANGKAFGNIMRPYFHWQVVRIQILNCCISHCSASVEAKGRVPPGNDAKSGTWLGCVTCEAGGADGDDTQ